MVSALSTNTKTLAHAAIGQAHASRVMLGGAGGGWLGPTASAALFHIMQHPELTHEECDQGRAVAWGAAPEEAAALRRMYPAKAARYGAVVHALATAASVEQRNVALGIEPQPQPQPYPNPNPISNPNPDPDSNPNPSPNPSLPSTLPYP